MQGTIDTVSTTCATRSWDNDNDTTSFIDMSSVPTTSLVSSESTSFMNTSSLPIASFASSENTSFMNIGSLPITTLASSASCDDLSASPSFSNLSTPGSFSNSSGYVSGEGVGEVANNVALKRRSSDFSETRFHFMHMWDNLICDLHDQPPGMKKRKSGNYQSTAQQCFTGRELVNWLYEHLKTSEYFRNRKIIITLEKARMLAVKLLENRTICNVKRPHEEKFSSADIYFIKAQRPKSIGSESATTLANSKEPPSIMLTPASCLNNENSNIPERARGNSIKAPAMTDYVDGAMGGLGGVSPNTKQHSSKRMLLPGTSKAPALMKKCKSFDNMPKQVRPRSPNQLSRSSTQQGTSKGPISPTAVQPEPSFWPSATKMDATKKAISEMPNQTSGGMIKPPKSPQKSPRVHPQSLSKDFVPRAQISSKSPNRILRSASDSSTRPIVRAHTTGGGTSGNSRSTEFGIRTSDEPAVRRRASADNPVTYESKWFFTYAKEKVEEHESPGGFVMKEVEISPHKAAVDTEYMNEPITLQDAISYVPLADEFLTVLEFLSESHYYEFYTAQAVPSRRESARSIPQQSQDWAAPKFDTSIYAPIGDIDLDDDNRPPQRAASRVERTYSGLNEYRNSVSDAMNCNPKKKRTGKNTEFRSEGGPSTALALNACPDEMVTCSEFLKDHQLLTFNEFLADGRK